MAPKKKVETPPPEPEDLEPPEPPGPTPEELLRMEATMLVGKFLRTSTYNPADGEPLLPPPPERPPPPSASQELEGDVSRLVARLAATFAQMCQQRGLEEDALPTSNAPGKVLGKGLHPGQFWDYLRWEEDGNEYRDIAGDLKMAVVRFVRAECKDGPSCGLTGNEKDAKYSMIRDLILTHLFRALNKDVRKEQDARIAKLWSSPPLTVESTANEEVEGEPALKDDSLLDEDSLIRQLIYEYEVRGDLTFANGLHETRLGRPDMAVESGAWLDYARFLMRTGPRQLDAEKALRRAISLLNMSSGPSKREVLFLALLSLNYREPSSISTTEQPLARFDATRGLLGTFVKEHPEEQVLFFFLFLAYALEAQSAQQEEAVLAELLEQEARAAAEAKAAQEAEEEAARAAEEAARLAAGLGPLEEEEQAADTPEVPTEAAQSAKAGDKPAKGKGEGKGDKDVPEAKTGQEAVQEGEEVVPEEEPKPPEPIVFPRSVLLAAQAEKFLALAKAPADELSETIQDLLAPTPEPVELQEPLEEEEAPDAEEAGSPDGAVQEEPPSKPVAAPPAAAPVAAPAAKAAAGKPAPTPEPPVEDDTPLVYYGPCIYSGPVPLPKHPDPDPQDEGALKCLDLMLEFGVSSFIKYLITEGAEAYGFVNSQTTAKSKEVQLRVIKALMLDRAWSEAIAEIAAFMDLCQGSVQSRRAYVLLGECHFQANRAGVVILEAPKKEETEEEDPAAEEAKATEVAPEGAADQAEEDIPAKEEGEEAEEELPKGEPVDSLAMAVTCFEQALTMPRDKLMAALPYERLFPTMEAGAEEEVRVQEEVLAQEEVPAEEEAPAAEEAPDQEEVVPVEGAEVVDSEGVIEEPCTPQDVEEELLIHLRLGSIFFEQVDKANFTDVELVDRVVQHYCKCIKLSPTSEAWLRVGICKYWQAQSQQDDRGARQAALSVVMQYFIEANLLDVAHPEPNAWLATCAVETGQVQVAKQAARQVLRHFHRLSAKTGLRLATVLLRHSDEAKAADGERPRLVQHCRYASEAIAVAEACLKLEETEEAHDIVAEAEKLMAQ
mmetsp:Transcript_39009/g.71015  ORF Transcript_39009/g.71015 Transcript_39009/m.71015 type:complete len:1063 (-) Transcript_39009:99-3287(-)